MAQSTPLRILSAGAPKAGVRRCVEAFCAQTGRSFQIEFATGPVIRERICAGTATPDVIAAPSHTIQEFIASGHVDRDVTANLGSIRAGAAIRQGSMVPVIDNITSFRTALLSADIVIFNRASSGLHLEKVLHQMELTDLLADRVVRTNTGAEAMAELVKTSAQRAIAFGQVTEIKAHANLGIHLIGPLPEEVGKQTNYDVGLSAFALNVAASSKLVQFCASDEGKHLLREAGIE